MERKGKDRSEDERLEENEMGMERKEERQKCILSERKQRC